MTRPVIPLEVYVAETLTQPFCLVDRRTRLGFDLTGKVVRFTVRDAISEPAILISKSTGSGIVHGNQATDPGLFTLTVPGADHTGLLPFVRVWDLWVDDELWIAPSPYDVRLSVRQP